VGLIQLNEVRKKAYNTLIYQAFLDIKISGAFNEENFYRNFRIAHAFHNLAEYIVLDFKGFNEERFWDEINALQEQFDLNHYKKIFDDAITQKAGNPSNHIETVGEVAQNDDK